MKALILAAAKGAAPMPLTRECPRPMLRILGTPLLELVIGRLRAHGVSQIVIDTDRHADAIEQYFGDGRRFGVEIAYACAPEGEHGERTGSAAVLRRIHAQAGFFDETFLVLPGDAIPDVNISALLARHHGHGALATVALSRDGGGQNVVILDDEARIIEFEESVSPPAPSGALFDAGMYLLEPGIVRHIPEIRAAGLAEHVLPSLAERGLSIYGLPADPAPLEIRTAADYHRICLMALRGELPDVALPGRELAPGVRVGLNVRLDTRRSRVAGPVVVANGATVEDGATLVGPCYVGPGAVVERGAHIEASVVLDHARVSGHAHLQGVTSDGRYCIGADGTVLDMRRADLDWLIADARTSRRALALAEQRFLDTFH